MPYDRKWLVDKPQRVEKVVYHDKENNLTITLSGCLYSSGNFEGYYTTFDEIGHCVEGTLEECIEALKEF